MFCGFSKSKIIFFNEDYIVQREISTSNPRYLEPEELVISSVSYSDQSILTVALRKIIGQFKMSEKHQTLVFSAGGYQISKPIEVAPARNAEVAFIHSWLQQSEQQSESCASTSAAALGRKSKFSNLLMIDIYETDEKNGLINKDQLVSLSHINLSTHSDVDVAVFAHDFWGEEIEQEENPCRELGEDEPANAAVIQNPLSS